MIERFEIIDHDSPRPEAERILFCDGTGGKLFRQETDLELSHWRPNRTPTGYRAGTSTEICFRFLDNPRSGTWTVAVNNHVDVDGILSVYALVHSDHALVHRQTIIEAAEMGDFWGWGEPPAQRVFQGITQLMMVGGEPKAIYEESFRRIPGLIDGSDPDVAQIEDSLTPLREGIELAQTGKIVRTEIAPRLTQYVIPLTVAGDNDARTSYVPEFNEAISSKALLWPQVRAYWDAERVCLVSTERENGWFHNLWFPGYLWADTEGKWLVPGFTYHDGMSSYDVQNDRLIAAFEQLQGQETLRAFGDWAERICQLAKICKVNFRWWGGLWISKVNRPAVDCRQIMWRRRWKECCIDHVERILEQSVGGLPVSRTGVSISKGRSRKAA